MRASRVNWIAVTLIVVVQMVLAAVWYGVFAESWAASLGKTLADFAEPKPTIYLLPIGKGLLGTAVLFQLLSRTGELTVAGGLKWAAFLWAGVVLPYDATRTIHSRDSRPG